VKKRKGEGVHGGGSIRRGKSTMVNGVVIQGRGKTAGPPLEPELGSRIKWLGGPNYPRGE
jgi:hypothetical protein